METQNLLCHKYMKLWIELKNKFQDSRYKKVWKIIDTQLILQLHSLLHVVAYYRNYYYLNHDCKSVMIFISINFFHFIMTIFNADSKVGIL